MKIAIVSDGLEERNARLQPWSYLLGLADLLKSLGHSPVLVSGPGALQVEAGSRLGFPSVPFDRRATPAKWARWLDAASVDVVFWHLGLTSFLHPDRILRGINRPVVGIFTSPVYRASDLFRLGGQSLISEYGMTLSPLAGLLVSRRMVARCLAGGITCLVTESETTRQALLRLGVAPERVIDIRPGLAAAWKDARVVEKKKKDLRRELGYREDDIVVGFFGPPPVLRGLPTLIRAVQLAHTRDARVKLLVLSRERPGEFTRQHRQINNEADSNPQWVKLIGGFLGAQTLVAHLASCDMVALPFELVPSDVPLSVLEAMALGLPVITTKVACLPEMVPNDRGVVIPPGDSQSLAMAILDLATHPARRMQMGRDGQEFVRDWTGESLRRRSISTLLEGLGSSWNPHRAGSGVDQG